MSFARDMKRIRAKCFRNRIAIGVLCYRPITVRYNPRAKKARLVK